MLRFAFLEEFGATVAAISDVSDGNCGFKDPEPGAAARNRERMCAAFSVNHRDIVCGQQVHGDRIALADEPDRGRQWGSHLEPFSATDAVLTATRGLPIAMFVADCVPVFLLDPRKRVAGMVHAGREGTFSRIAAKAISAMRERCGTRPADVRAVIGPSAGPCCYEVGQEMADAFIAAGFPATGRRLDLWTANAMQLLEAGLSKENIAIAGTCTICTGAFFSHRRDVSGARNMAIMML